MFPYDASLNTFEPLFELSNSVPNWKTWNDLFKFGTSQLMIYLTELLSLMMIGRRSSEI